MRIGLGSYACTWRIGVPGYPVAEPMDAIGLIDEAIALGLGLVQIDDNLPLEDLSPVALERVLAYARNHGIALEVGTRGSDPARLRTFAAIASAAGSPVVRVVLDRSADQPSVAEAIARLSAVGDDYLRAGLLLAVENHDRFTVVDLQRIMEGSGGHVRICLDTVNSLGAGEGPREVLEGLRPWVVNLHLKDFRVRRADHQMGFIVEGVPAGDGQLDIPWAMGRLAGTCPTAILELWTPPDPVDLAATIARERAWTKRSVANLRRILPGACFA